jgi:carotenoid cleavage dioxygenase-like enzyme
MLDLSNGQAVTSYASRQCGSSLLQIGGKYTVYRSQPGSPKREVIARIPLRSGTIPSWVHDFPYTENYMILPETPVYFDLKVWMHAAVWRHLSCKQLV